VIAQGTSEWLAERLGKATASRISDIMAKTKSGPSASRQNYVAELVAERLSGVGGDFYVNAAMQRGTELEPLAREAYSFESGNTVVETGFVPHPTIAMSGASPDGLIGDDGLVEIKCPGGAKHLATLTGASIDGKYVCQMQWQMACTGRAWCDFVSYDPRWPVEMQLATRRVERDVAAIAEMEREVAAFLAEVAATVSLLTERYRKAA
jgi:putative phage-type endonuclease